MGGVVSLYGFDVGRSDLLVSLLECRVLGLCCPACAHERFSAFAFSRVADDAGDIAGFANGTS